MCHHSLESVRKRLAMTANTKMSSLGKASLVTPMAVASIAAGADGLIIEVHPNPEKAMSDGYQSLTPAAFRQLIAECRKVAQALGKKI